MDLPRRVLMIALDALDHRWLRNWIDEGRLPNLARFAARAHQIEVRSDGELLHGSVWPTFASGAGPGHHGIYWWTQWIAEVGRYERNSHPALHYHPFWRQLALAGKRTIVVDLPYVPPVRDGHTWTAMGWGLHDEVEPASYPERFLPAIRSRYGEHPLRMDTMHSMDPREKRRMAARMANGVGRRARLVADIAARGDWELFITTFSEFHKAGHYLAAREELSEGATNDDAMASVAQAFDAALPAILEAAGEGADVVIFGLHGMEPQIEYSRLAAQFAALVDGRDLDAAAPAPDLIRRLRDLMPDRLQQAIWYLLPPGVRQRRYTGTVAQGLHGNERLFHVAHDGALALRLNLAARELRGTLSEDAGAGLLESAAAIAATVTTVDGTHAFQRLVRPPELHPGPRAHRLPDALLPLNPAVFEARELLAPGGLRLLNSQPEARNGVHTSTGFCFYRPGPSSALLRDSIDSKDFAPTILERFGLPPLDWFEGSGFLGRARPPV